MSLAGGFVRARRVAGPMRGQWAVIVQDQVGLAQVGGGGLRGEAKTHVVIKMFAKLDEELPSEFVVGVVKGVFRIFGVGQVSRSQAGDVESRLRVLDGNVDFDGQIGDIPSGKTAKRLRTSEGAKSISISPSDKVIGRIRKTRKDIFLVGFKTTCGESADVQYKRGIELLKINSANLVLANDTASMLNMICAPEEARYAQTGNREECLAFLAKMAISRMQNTFTRSTVVDAPTVPWTSDTVPANLRDVVDHCIERGAYKPILGKTAGHFAVKVGDGKILTSIRKSNFNDLGKVGLVKVESSGDHEVIAYGAKPSVGGQSQRIIFKEHEAEGLDCIVHFHCPVRADAPMKAMIPVKEQWPNECGSHECGRNTSRGLGPVDLGGGDKLSVVFLDEHGPNIVFNRKTPAAKVKAFIDGNFDLSAKTGGLVAN